MSKFEHPPIGHLASLDSWRGICALLVAVHHFVLFSVNEFNYHAIESFFLFVDFFFVLSGFVISLNYSTRITTTADLADFIARRFARVWPLHAVVMIGFVCVYLVIRTIGTEAPYTIGASSTTYLPLKFPLVLALFNSFGAFSGGWNLPSWSISAEFATYLVFASCMLSRYRYALIFAFTLLGAYYVFAVSETHINLTANFGVFRCLYGFGVGVGAHHIYAHAQQRGLLSAISNTSTEIIALIALIAFLHSAATPSGEATPTSVFAPILFSFIIIAYSGQRGTIGRLLRLRPFLKIGQWSYSIYITHWLVLISMAAASNALHPAYKQVELWGGIYWKWDLSSPTAFLIALAIYLAILLSISSISYLVIEDPCRKAASNYLKRRKTAKGKATIVSPQ